MKELIEDKPRRGCGPKSEDLLRMEALTVPGVLNGTLVTQETEEGIWETDFDHRDEFGNWTRKFTPKPGFKVASIRVAVAEQTVYVRLAPDSASK